MSAYTPPTARCYENSAWESNSLKLEWIRLTFPLINRHLRLRWPNGNRQSGGDEALETRTQIQNGSRNLRLFLERLGIGVERTSESILYRTGTVTTGPGIQAAVN